MATAETLSSRKCFECKRKLPDDGMILFLGSAVCAGCKPLFFQRMREGLDVSTGLPPAGLDRRFLAKLIDWFITGATVTAITAGVMFALSVSISEPGADGVIIYMILLYSLQFLLPMLYNTYFVGRFGATLGKMALSIKVVVSDGERVSYRRALARHFGEMLSYITAGVGYLMAFVDDERRALHDRICNTRVISSERSLSHSLLIGQSPEEVE